MAFIRLSYKQRACLVRADAIDAILPYWEGHGPDERIVGSRVWLRGADEDLFFDETPEQILALIDGDAKT